MVSLIYIATLVLLAKDCCAAPTAETKKGFTGEVHRYVPSYAQISPETGAVEAVFDGGGWILPVLIGGQQVILNLDTGSSDL
jgi:aspergillopepsin I